MEKMLNKFLNNWMDKTIFTIAVQKALTMFDIFNEELEYEIMEKTLNNSLNNLMNKIISIIVI